jgi:NAD-dependent deacetylase
MAKESGAKLAIVNLEPTEKDFLFDVAIYGKAAEILPKVLEEYRRLKS